MFDFDGLIADTETPEFETWCEEFRHHGAELHIDEWIKCVGAGPTVWDVFEHLQTFVPSPLDREAVMQRRSARFREVTSQLSVMPGVVELLDQAQSNGVACGVASSSTSDWVGGYLERFGLTERFSAIVTRDMVASPKPAPDLYLEACRRLGVESRRAVALEDSVNGVNAALAAGMKCIAVPNTITARFDLSHASRVVPTLKELDWATFETLFAMGSTQAPTSAH